MVAAVLLPLPCPFSFLLPTRGGGGVGTPPTFTEARQ